MLSFIEERLGELEREKDELKAYESLDKKRKAIEYSLYDKELSRCLEQLGQVDVAREEERMRHQEVYGGFRDLQDELQEEEERLAVLRAAVERLVTRRQEKTNLLGESRRRKAELEVAKTEKLSLKEEVLQKKAQLESEILWASQEKSRHEAELATVEPEYERLKAQREAILSRLTNSAQRAEELYAKQGRGSQFTSMKARDKFLREQIQALNEQQRSKAALLETLSQEVSAEREKCLSEQEVCESMHRASEVKTKQIEMASMNILSKVSARNQLQERRKNLWREQERLSEKILEAKSVAEKARKSLNASLPKHTAQGLAAVSRIVEERAIRGYYGPLVDNFSLKNEAFRTCVEVAAGNALFYVIVEDDTVAATLIKELERRKAGRLTFLPLNRLRNSPVTYPISNDVRPLMDSALTYEPKFEPAVRMVFGKKLLARDLEVAAIFSRSSGLDAVTREGDIVNRRGGFEGGFHDDRRSRIAAVQKMRIANAELDEYFTQDAALKKLAEELELDVTEELRSIQEIERERENLVRECERNSVELTNKRKLLEAAQSSLERKTARLSLLKTEVSDGEYQISNYRSEIGTSLEATLSDQERDELRTLLERQKAAEEELQRIEESSLEVAEHRDRLKADILTNYKKRIDEARQQLESLALQTDSSKVADIAETEENILIESDNMVILDADIASIEGSIESKRKEIVKLEKIVADKRIEESELSKIVDGAVRAQDKLLSKRSLLQENVQQKQRLIRDLGTIPRKELEDLNELSEKHLFQRLKGVNDELKQYASVNRKAFDQYVSFNDQRENLIERGQQLAKDKSAIDQLLVSLDQQKEEAILRTFNDVHRHFSEVFNELVPDGEGLLEMMSSMDADSNETSSDRTEERRLVTFSGVQIKVSFGGAGHHYEMQQLSGGQKALVALALIFAIQRSDPAPFYLFDEIDQALDANYRTSVASLIRRQAVSNETPTQFITTTFRPELVQVADKHYGISLQHKVSSILPLEKVIRTMLIA